MLMRPAATTRQVLHAPCRRLKLSQQTSSAHARVETTFKRKAAMLTHRTTNTQIFATTHRNERSPRHALFLTKSQNRQSTTLLTLIPISPHGR